MDLGMFRQMVKDIEDKQVERFRSKLPPEGKTMPRREFLIVLLDTFLGNHLLDYKRMAKLGNAEFGETCDQAIDSVSLCGPEVAFFHEMTAACMNSSSTTEAAFSPKSCVKLFDATPRLAACQLGPTIRRCLDASAHLELA